MKREHRTILIQIALFIATVITATLAGAEWLYGKSIFLEGYQWSDFVSGLEYSIPFLGILTVHEFGHYFMARYHRVKSSLPYYLPLPPLPLSIGTMGAMIRLRQKVYSKRQTFDIGIAGPLAGFVATLIVLFYGFTHLPDRDYIFTIHPEYKQYGYDYAEKVYTTANDQVADVVLGTNLLFMFFEKFVADPERMPNPHELMHYPWLFAGFLSLVFTSLNLMPVGQLDGGHVVYGLFGFRIHRIIASIAFIAFLVYSGIGVIDVRQPASDLMLWLAGGALFLYTVLTGLRLQPKTTVMTAFLMLALFVVVNWFFPDAKGYSGWILFALLLGRFVGITHPRSEIEEPLDTKRIILGWIALIIFVISFSPAPLVIR